MLRETHFITGVTLETTGEDKEGVIADFTRILAELNCCNIETLDSHLTRGKGGKNLFHLRVECGAEREFTEEDITVIREKTRALKEKHKLTKCDVGILRHKRVMLD